MASSGMESDAPRPFGGALPGDAGILEVVNVKKLLQSRAMEIEQLMNALKGGNKQDMVFQKLPFVLRRRAMSHNPFRVPKKIRIHMAREMSRNVPKCAKRLRKDRRKRLNRLKEYRTRCIRNKWLETHLYHAKRFKMVSLWEYRIALRATQKCRRRCLRYCKRHSVVHDMSYVRVVSVTGRLSELRNACRGIFSDASLMFEEHVLTGTYRSHTFAYAKSGDKQKLICPVHFVWVPSRANEENREIWFFVHPSAIQEFYSTISDSGHCIQCYIRYDVCTFEVMGPLSSLLLRSTLKVDDSHTKGNSLWRSFHPENIDIPPSYILPLSVMDPTLYGNMRPSFTLDKMRAQSFRTGQGGIEPLTAEERRRFYDFKSTKDSPIVTKANIPRLRRRNWGKMIAKLLNNASMQQQGKTSTLDRVEANSQAPMNNNQEAERAGSNKEKLHKKNEACSLQNGNIKAKLNDKDVSAAEEKGYVPILLIRRGDAIVGFDLVIPAGTIARKLWILLNRYGALGIGIQERKMLYAQHHQCMFPQDYPETLAGQQHYELIEAEKTRKHLSTPANKRPNYMFMGVARPFSILRWNIDRATDGSSAAETLSQQSNILKGSDETMYKPKDVKSSSTGSCDHSSVVSCLLRELPENWKPKSYIKRKRAGYMQSRHLLLGCITAGIHYRDSLKYPDIQVLRVSRSSFNAANLYLRQLLNALETSGYKKVPELDRTLLLACTVEVLGHGSLSSGTRIYVPSPTDLQSNSEFILEAMNHNGNTPKAGLKVDIYGSKPGSRQYAARVPKAFDEPVHEEYKLGSLKELFGCTGKRTKINISTAFNGLQALEKKHRPSARKCFGTVTSRGFSHRGNCLLDLRAFMDLLQRTVTTYSINTGKHPPLISMDQIRLFVWIRNTHSREYVAGIVSLTFHGGFEGSL